MNLDILYVVIYSYCLGSIPFGLIITKIFLDKDIRDIGSGNIGSTNVLRTGKKSLATATLLALICFIGHIFPVWLKFKGGKGVATYLGIILGISFLLGIFFGVIWLLTAIIFRYSSLSSILGSMIICIYSFYLNNETQSYLLSIMFVIIVFTHKENIIKLKNSKENKIKL